MGEEVNEDILKGSIQSASYNMILMVTFGHIIYFICVVN